MTPLIITAKILNTYDFTLRYGYWRILWLKIFFRYKDPEQKLHYRIRLFMDIRKAFFVGDYIICHIPHLLLRVLAVDGITMIVSTVDTSLPIKESDLNNSPVFLHNRCISESSKYLI